MFLFSIFFYKVYFLFILYNRYLQTIIVIFFLNYKETWQGNFLRKKPFNNKTTYFDVFCLLNL